MAASRFAARNAPEQCRGKPVDVDSQLFVAGDVDFRTAMLYCADNLSRTDGGIEAASDVAVHFVRGRAIGVERVKSRIRADVAGTNYGDGDAIIGHFGSQRIEKSVKCVLRSG